MQSGKLSSVNGISSIIMCSAAFNLPTVCYRNIRLNVTAKETLEKIDPEIGSHRLISLVSQFP
jgi:precorrin-2 methylase